MILDLTDVCSCENKELTKEAVIELTSFDSKLGVFPFIEKKPFELRIVNEENKDLLIHGETDVRIAIPCDRCLEEVPTDSTLYSIRSSHWKMRMLRKKRWMRQTT